MIEYLTTDLKIERDQEIPEMFIGVYPEKKQYTFESDRPKPVIKWVNINELGRDGWELINIIPRHLDMIAVFKRIIKPQ